MSHGEGSRLYDVDGREYIDWMMAFGALPLGHAHPKIVETVTKEIARGSHFATALEVEVEVAEILVDLLPHVEKIRFANTGTEAAMAAISQFAFVYLLSCVVHFASTHHCMMVLLEIQGLF